jgi:D-alanyl-D-alanine carboxypeptidase (penicillin-binding protein 5/6)
MNLALIGIACLSMLGLSAPSSLIAHQKVTAVTPAQASSSAPVPIKQNDSSPAIYAAAVYAVDAKTGTVLYAKNADQPRPIASLTKMMTVLATLRDHKLDEQVIIPQLPAYQPGDALAGLIPGDTMSVKDLVAASLIPSHNDAADTLAIYNSETKDKFYGKMNTIAKEWGMTSATFASASGLQDAGNQASAKDMGVLARLGLYNKTFSELTATKTMKITSGQGRVYTLNTTNDLLDGAKVRGLKTGYTLAAGECLITLSTIQGHDVITVMLGSYDRFGETARLIDWLSNTYSWHSIN